MSILDDRQAKKRTALPVPLISIAYDNSGRINVPHGGTKPYI